MNVKKLAAWPLSWGFWLIGHVTSKVCHWPEKAGEFFGSVLADLYLWSMRWSFTIQDWADENTKLPRWPWGKYVTPKDAWESGEQDDSNHPWTKIIEDLKSEDQD